MREVTVDKAEFRAKVQENRDKHRGVYETALEGYRNTVVQWFDQQLKKAKEGLKFSTTFHLPQPEDHTEDYDRVLEMIEMSQDDTFTLTSQEFDQFVRDNWGWQRNFAQTASYYVSE